MNESKARQERLVKAEQEVQDWSKAHPVFSPLQLTDAPCFDELDLAMTDCIQVEAGSITLHFGGYPYEIDLKRIPNPLSLLHWVDHLSNKRWMDMRRVQAFIVRVCEVKGWELYNYNH